MATALGARYLSRYAEGTCTLEQLRAAREHGWVTPDEYDTATATAEAPTES